MKIGFVVSFFDFRNDVRRVLKLVAQQHTVIVYGHQTHKETIMKHLPSEIEFRLIDEEKRTLKNRLLNYLYLLIKKIPQSEQNYYLMEWFKAANINDAVLQKKARKIINRQRRLPKVMRYDFLLNNLEYKGKTKIDDIDQFVLFTDVADNNLLARLIKEQKPVKLYVYSWDHSFKHTRFSNYPRYLCWSDGIKDDLSKIQNIPITNIRVIGASQFGYIHEFKQQLAKGSIKRSFPYEYIYFGFAIGILDIVEDELNIAKQLAIATLKLRPDLKFIVRPYPILSKWELYEDLRKLPNVILDDDFRGKDLSLKDEHILEKLEKINNAIAFLHLGTTMGLEACYTETPSFIVDFENIDKSVLSLHSFIHQSQNEKYLINLSSKNTLKSIGEYEAFLMSKDKKAYLDLNKKVRQLFPINSFEEFSEALILS